MEFARAEAARGTHRTRPACARLKRFALRFTVCKPFACEYSHAAEHGRCCAPTPQSHPPTIIPPSRDAAPMFEQAAALRSSVSEAEAALAHILKKKDTAGLRKAHILFLCRVWGYGSDLWRETAPPAAPQERSPCMPALIGSLQPQSSATLRPAPGAGFAALSASSRPRMACVASMHARTPERPRPSQAAPGTKFRSRPLWRTTGQLRIAMVGQGCKQPTPPRLPAAPRRAPSTACTRCYVCPNPACCTFQGRITEPLTSARRALQRARSGDCLPDAGAGMCAGLDLHASDPVNGSVGDLLEPRPSVEGVTEVDAEALRYYLISLLGPKADESCALFEGRGTRAIAAAPPEDGVRSRCRDLCTHPPVRKPCTQG